MTYLVHTADLQIQRVPGYNDEPRITQYHARGRVGDVEIDGYGCDLQPDVAERKAFFEVVERIALATISPRVVRGRKSEVADAVDPLLFQCFTAEQLASPGFRRMQVTDHSAFSWFPVRDEIVDGPAWIPAQLVQCPFDTSHEAILRAPSSSGAACGDSLDEARCKAALEIIERDAFMCWFLANTPAFRLDPRSEHLRLADLPDLFERYRVGIDLLLLPSPWGYPVVLAVIQDDTGIGPRLTVGLKCHPSVVEAARGALFEAYQIRVWLRDYLVVHGLPRIAAKDVRDYWTRGLYWSNPRRALLMRPLLMQPIVSGEALDAWTSPANDWGMLWKEIVTTAADASMHVYSATLDPCPQAPETVVVKVVMPECHPLYLDERYPYLSSVSLSKAQARFGARWKRLVPHPFT